MPLCRAVHTGGLTAPDCRQRGARHHRRPGSSTATDTGPVYTPQPNPTAATEPGQRPTATTGTAPPDSLEIVPGANVQQLPSHSRPSRSRTTTSLPTKETMNDA